MSEKKEWVLKKTVTHRKMTGPRYEYYEVLGSIPDVLEFLNLPKEASHYLKKQNFYQTKDDLGHTITLEIQRKVIQ